MCAYVSVECVCVWMHAWTTADKVKRDTQLQTDTPFPLIPRPPRASRVYSVPRGGGVFVNHTLAQGRSDNNS